MKTYLVSIAISFYKYQFGMSLDQKTPKIKT